MVQPVQQYGRRCHEARHNENYGESHGENHDNSRIRLRRLP